CGSEIDELVGRNQLAAVGGGVEGVDAVDELLDLALVVGEDVDAEVEAGHHFGHALGFFLLFLVEGGRGLLGGHPDVEQLLSKIIELS
ncbi:hypothetical protein KEM55_007484, partial [Ascosphaera atra]